MTMTNLSLDPLTWIIYQGHLSTRCPPSPTHASTNHVSKSPIYHHNICVCTIPCTMHINTYTIPCANHAHQQHLYYTMFQPCTSTCTTICTITSVYLNNVSISMVDLEHNNQLPNKIIHISRASRILQGLTSISVGSHFWFILHYELALFLSISTYPFLFLSYISLCFKIKITIQDPRYFIDSFVDLSYSLVN
jgi:hypothetical protein